MSQPVLDEEADRYYRQFLMLSRERRQDIVPMGLAGSISMPRQLLRKDVEEAAHRWSYEGDALADFVEIILGIDDKFVELGVKKSLADAQRAAAKAKTGRR